MARFVGLRWDLHLCLLVFLPVILKKNGLPILVIVIALLYAGKDVMTTPLLFYHYHLAQSFLLCLNDCLPGKKPVVI